MISDPLLTWTTNDIRESRAQGWHLLMPEWTHGGGPPGIYVTLNSFSKWTREEARDFVAKNAEAGDPTCVKAVMILLALAVERRHGQ
jgi:hypothetical protein